MKKNTKPDEWMPFYVEKYLADTTMFTPEMHGAYVLLLLSAWRNKGELPDDDRRLAVASKCTPSQWRKLRPVIAEKFEIAGGVWRQKRLVAVLEQATKRYASKVANGKLGGRPKGTGKKTGQETERLSEPKDNTERTKDKEPTTSRSDLLSNQSPNGDLSGASPPDVPPLEAKEQRTRKLRAEAVLLLAFLNEKTGRKYEPVPANVDPIVARLKEGFEPVIVRQVIARKCRQWGGDEKMDEYLRPKTLFSATNFANYAGEIVPEPEGAPS